MISIDFLKTKFINGQKYNLDTIIKNAYKDIQTRTIKGHNKEVQESGIKYLKEEFEKILLNSNEDQDFDAMHEKLCEGFLEAINGFLPEGQKQKYGKAQKVVNIIFKFLVAYNKFSKESVCHMPIDSFVLKWVYKKEKYNGKTAWSYIEKDDYKKIQQDISEKIDNGQIEINNKKFCVNNKIEADYYVWYITKVNRDYQDVKNALHKLKDRIDEKDENIIDKKIVSEIQKATEEVVEKLTRLKFS